MDLKHIVNQPWEVLHSFQTSQASPTASTSTAASTSNAEFRDMDFRKPVLVPVKKLYLDSEQVKAIRSIYAENEEYRMRFNTTALSQASAERVLRENGLPRMVLPQDQLQGRSQGQPQAQPQVQPQNKLDNCWLTAWSSTWGSKKGSKKRSLFQCSSGYSTAARQARDKRGSQNPIEWSRQGDYRFTACLAHADVTWNRDSGEIERIIGHFGHSPGCEADAVIRSVLKETQPQQDEGEEAEGVGRSCVR